MPAAFSSGSEAGVAPGERGRSHPGIHWAWRVAVIITICTGLFHLINLVDAGRVELGPVLVTPFRLAFMLSWLLLMADYGVNHRLPHVDYADVLVASLAALFLMRGIFVAETFGIAVNWVLTGAGVFFLIKHGMRDRFDACLVLWTIVAAVLVICLFGLLEYMAKSNPLFASIQVQAIGADIRIGASDQFYRIRSLVGHPGFAAAIPLACIPLIAMVLWRRRLLMTAALLLAAATIFLTFSRGSWLLAALVLLPLGAYLGRFWLRNNLKWLALAALLLAMLAAVSAVGYWQRQEVSDRLSEANGEAGLRPVQVRDGGYSAVEGEGVRPEGSYLYFDIDDGFYHGGDGAVTLVLYYLDDGYGRVRIEYVPAEGTDNGEMYRSSAAVDKTGTGRWTTAAFYLEDARFQGGLNGADFRVVDEDGQAVFSKVTLRKGRLSLPEVVAQQWLSRRGSLATRLEFFSFTWNLVREHPLGVGLFNTPGTGHHAIDSLPLTWVIEFGWPGLLLLAALAALVLREGVLAGRNPWGPPAVVFLSLLILLLHGAFLMILYDKPSLIMAASLGAVYASVRPWGKGGAAIELDGWDCVA